MNGHTPGVGKMGAANEERYINRERQGRLVIGRLWRIRRFLNVLVQMSNMYMHPRKHKQSP